MTLRLLSSAPKGLTAATLVGVLALAGVAPRASAQEGKVTKDSVGAPPPAAATNVVANLQPRTGGRTRATLTLSPGRRQHEVRARISVIDATPDAQLGWLIRQGQCGEQGPEYGPVAAYRPLMVRGDGTAELAVYLPIAMPRNNAFQALLLAERGSSTVLACGGLSEESK